MSTDFQSSLCIGFEGTLWVHFSVSICVKSCLITEAARSFWGGVCVHGGLSAETASSDVRNNRKSVSVVVIGFTQVIAHAPNQPRTHVVPFCVFFTSVLCEERYRLVHTVGAEFINSEIWTIFFNLAVPVRTKLENLEQNFQLGRWIWSHVLLYCGAFTCIDRWWSIPSMSSSSSRDSLLTELECTCACSRCFSLFDTRRTVLGVRCLEDDFALPLPG